MIDTPFAPIYWNAHVVLKSKSAIWWICCIFAINMFCVYYVIWTESLCVSGRAGANHNAQWHPEFLFRSWILLMYYVNLILCFMYVNQKLSCKMGSNKVFLNLNLKKRLHSVNSNHFNSSDLISLMSHTVLSFDDMRVQSKHIIKSVVY